MSENDYHFHSNDYPDLEQAVSDKPFNAVVCRVGPCAAAYRLVQPCDVDRRPRGIAIGIGPVLTEADASAVAAWLARGSLDATCLEPRLRLPAHGTR